MKRLALFSLISLVSGLAASPSFAASGKSAEKTQALPAAAPSGSPVSVSGSVEGWSYRCVYPGSSLKSAPLLCTIEQSLAAQEKGKSAIPLGAIIFARATADAKKEPLTKRPWRLTLVTPLGLSLIKPARFAVDTNTPLSLTWQSCVQTGCLSVIELSDAQAKTIRQGKQGHMEISKLPEGNGILTINLSLSGLDGAMTAIDQLITHAPSH